jgi:hypothetical protein
MEILKEEVGFKFTISVFEASATISPNYRGSRSDRSALNLITGIDRILSPRVNRQSKLFFESVTMRGWNRAGIFGEVVMVKQQIADRAADLDISCKNREPLKLNLHLTNT